MKLWALGVSVVLHAALLSLTCFHSGEARPRAPEQRVVIAFFVAAPEPVEERRHPPPVSEPAIPALNREQQPEELQALAHEEPQPGDPMPVEPALEQATESPPPPARGPGGAEHPAAAPEPPPALEPPVAATRPSPHHPATPSLPAPRQTPKASEGPAQAPATESSLPLAMTPPRALDTPRPRYPRSARRRGHQGTVLLRAVVDPRGRITTLTIVESSGHDALDREAERCLREVHFEPARRGSHAVEGSIEIPITFQLR